MGRPSLSQFLSTVAGATLVCAVVQAATPEDAPPRAREQVANALATLAPAFEPRRKIAAGSPGSVEEAISRYVPARFHPMSEGTLPARRATVTCPDDMRPAAGRYCVDRYEGSLLEKGDDGVLREHSPYDALTIGRSYVARSVAGVLPQAYISAEQAQAACVAAGKRLCQPVEWRAACGGSDGYAFPYGPTRKPGLCHDSGAAPMLVFYAETMKRGWGLIEMNDPRLNQLDNTVGKTGAWPACVNDYGLYDMVGNLHEWTADPNGTFQGGYWLDTKEHGDGCAYRTIAHPYDYHDYSTGFRCCADSKPKADTDAGTGGDGHRLDGKSE